MTYPKTNLILDAQSITTTVQLLTSAPNLVNMVNYKNYSITFKMSNVSAFVGNVQPLVSNNGGADWTLFGSQVALPTVDGGLLTIEGEMLGTFLGLQINRTSGSADITAWITQK